MNMFGFRFQRCRINFDTFMFVNTLSRIIDFDSKSNPSYESRLVVFNTKHNNF